MTGGWSVKALGDLFEISRGGSPRPIQDFLTEDVNGVNWIMISDASASGKYIERTAKRIRPEGVARSRRVSPGDFLLTNSMSFGRPYIMKTEGCIHDGWLHLKKRDKSIDEEYFYHLLGSEATYSKFERLAAGATVKNLNIDLVSSVKVPVPPLLEQRRIATILDKADNLHRKRQEAIRLANDFLTAVFSDMFGDPDSNPKGFEIGTIRDLVASANYGTSEKASEEVGRYAILRMNNITYQGGWDFSSLKYVDLEPATAHKYLTQRGDLLFNRTNSKELVGKTAVYMRDEPMAIAGYLVRVRMNERGNPHYVSGYLNSVHGKRSLEARAKSIVGMANINAQEMQDIPLLLPPIQLQVKYARIVEAVNARLETHQAFLRDAVALQSALSHKFFGPVGAGEPEIC